MIAGAWWTHNDAHTHAELFDPATGLFTATGTLNTPRAYPVVVALDDGDALVIGGTGPNGQSIGSRIERYRAAQGDFVAVTSAACISPSSAVTGRRWGGVMSVRGVGVQ